MTFGGLVNPARRFQLIRLMSTYVNCFNVWESRTESIWWDCHWGRIAVDFALTFPRQTRSLVLAAPGLSGWKYAPNYWDSFINAMENIDDPTWAKIAAAEAWLACPYLAPAMNLPRLKCNLRRWGRENGQSLFRDDDQFETKLNPPAIDRLTEISVQTLVMIGIPDVSVIKCIVARMEKKIRNSILTCIENVGHMINLEDPDRFHREVLAFLKTVV